MAETKAKTTKTASTRKKTGADKDSSVGKTSKEILDKGLEASKKWFASAKKTISEWGDEGVKQVEIVKLNSKMEKGYTALGRLVYAKLSGSKAASVSKDDEEIGEVVKLLSDMARKIKKLGGTPSKSTAKKSAKKDDEEEVKALPDKTASTRKRASSRKADGTAEKTTTRARKSASGSTASKKTTAKKSTAKTAASKKTTSKRTSTRSKKSEE
jgi:hypothetical protein